MPSQRFSPVGQCVGVLLLALCLLWPAFWSGAPLAFHDSASYHNGGAVAVDYFLDKIGVSAVPDTGSGPAATGDGGGGASAVGSIRSIPFSLFTYLSTRLFGLSGSVALAALATAWLIWLALAPLPVWTRLAAGAAVVSVTSVAFYASQMMPDIFAAWLILIPVIVVQRDGRPGLWPGLALLAAAGAAILFHYSHIPLAAAMGLGLGAWYLWRRRPWAALVVQAPLVLAMAFNIAISAALPGSTSVSVTPARLPILLARSLEDGVAVRYLTERCGVVDFTICDVYDVFPTSVGQALWGEDSIRARATPEQMAKIRDQEFALAWQVFLYDPPAQTWAMIGNAAHQFVRFGLDDVMTASFDMRAHDELYINLNKTKVAWFGWVESVEILSVALAAAVLGGLVFLLPSSRVPVALLVLGLLANAVVCGGLSAPADRYQGRIIWLVVLLAVGFGLHNRAVIARSFPVPGHRMRERFSDPS